MSLDSRHLSCEFIQMKSHGSLLKLLDRVGKRNREKKKEPKNESDFRSKREEIN